jgi:hypothetical protein
MPIKHKHSPTSGNRANLTPGEIGHNRPEDVLLIRGNLQKLEISLADWRTRGVPLEGPIGAPLTHVGGVLTYDPTLLTAGQVDGGFFTDEPPGLNAWGVPGFVQVQPDFENDIDPDSLLPKTTFAQNDVRIEDFYVASDEINISHIGCRTIYTGAGSPPPIRVGLVNAAGVILAEKRYLSAPSLIAAYVGPLTLTRGTYSLVAWIGGALDLVRVSGERLNLSFEYDGHVHLRRTRALRQRRHERRPLCRQWAGDHRRHLDRGRRRQAPLRALVPGHAQPRARSDVLGGHPDHALDLAHARRRGDHRSRHGHRDRRQWRLPLCLGQSRLDALCDPTRPPRRSRAAWAMARPSTPARPSP